MTKALQRIMTLENELKILDSYILALETKHKDEVATYEDEIMQIEHDLEKSDNKIADLEYELFLEKTRDSKNKFYWFTAKKRPPIADVSYMSKGNLLYGFKETPHYTFIEHHDLRFITHCSLDDLIEQF